MILKAFVGLMIIANLFFYFGRDSVKDFLADSRQQAITPLVKGAKDVKIANASFEQEVFYGMPGFYTLKDQLNYLGVQLNKKDKVIMVPSPELGLGGEVKITRANKIKLIDGRETRDVYTWSTTTEDFLQENNIVLDKTDKILPSLLSKISNGDSIKITRIGIKEEKVTEDFEFSEKVEIDKQKDVCSVDVIKDGSKGILTKFFRVTYENGEETSRIKTKEEVTKKPIDRLIVKGGKVEPLGQGKATWYNWRPGEAAHNTLPKGTMVKVINLANNKSTIVKITDRGIHRSEVIIDLDARSFKAIGALWQGILQVRLEKACN